MTGQRLRIVQGFASDASALIASVKDFKVQAIAQEPNESLLEGPGALFPDWMQTLIASPMNAQSIQRVELTVHALKDIARRLHSVPGRKNLIWISGGFPIQVGLDRLSSPVGSTPPQSFTLEIESATRALNDAGVAVYPIDARGLESFRRPVVGAHANPELAGAMRRALDDAETSYTLGFYLNPEDLDNKFHSLRVQVNRKDVVMRSRRGYLASKDRPTDDSNRLKELGQLLASPLESTTIKVGAKTAVTHVAGKRRVPAHIFIDTPRITMHDRDGKKTGAVDIVLDLQASDGRSLAQTSRTLHLNLTEANYRKMLDQSLPDHPEGVRLCLAVLDRLNGATGSASRKWPQDRRKLALN